MREVRHYALIGVDEDRAEARLSREGRALDVRVQGTVLEAQFALADGTCLLWLTEDCPFEEGLHVYLLGPEGFPLDALWAGAPYTPGMLRLHATGEDWVDFAFFGDERCRLHVEPRARFQWGLPKGWGYARWFARHRLAVRPPPV